MALKIKSLLDKFFEGETSLQEEQELKNYYSKSELSEDLKVYDPLFQLFSNEKSIEINNPDFRQNIINSIVSDLVEKYFEGNSTIEEEKTLKTYFSGDLVSEALKTYKPIFDFSENEVGLSLGSSFDAKLKTELIKSLLEKYFEGESSSEEEKELKSYFAGGDVSTELKIYSNLFDYFDLEKGKEVSRAFDLKLEKKLQGSESSQQNKPVVRRMFPQMARAAAAVLVLVGAVWFISSNGVDDSTLAQSKTIDWSKYEPKNPEEAYKKTMEALAMVSTKMKDGEEQTLKGFRKIKTANDAAGL